MELREDVVDIIVPFYRTEHGLARLETMKKSLETVDPGFPYRLLIAEGQKPCVQNRNDGLRQSNTRRFVMCDDDIIFTTPGWLKKAVDTMVANPMLGAVGFRAENIQGQVINSGRLIVTQDTVNYSVDAAQIDPQLVYQDGYRNQVAGCLVLIDRLIAGYYPQNLYPGKVNAEDVDYIMTIQANGYKVYYLGTVPVIHNESTPAEKVDKYKLTPLDLLNHRMFEQRWGLVTANMTRKEEQPESQKQEEMKKDEPNKHTHNE